MKYTFETFMPRNTFETNWYLLGRLWAIFQPGLLEYTNHAKGTYTNAFGGVSIIRRRRGKDE